VSWLRGIAAIVVVIFHDLSPFDLDSLIPHAPLAVDFFFCLSGFVVAYAYEKRLLGTMSSRILWRSELSDYIR
jgi:peptidoglycan/LPS O-acetylase OafA/YrhL